MANTLSALHFKTLPSGISKVTISRYCLQCDKKCHDNYHVAVTLIYINTSFDLLCSMMRNTAFIVFFVQLAFCKISVDKKCNVDTNETDYKELTETLRFCELIGSGSYGDIYKFPIKEQPHCKITVKVIKSDEKDGTFDKEVDALKLLADFPYSPTLYGSFKSKNGNSQSNFIFMEHIEGVDLFNLQNFVIISV